MVGSPVSEPPGTMATGVGRCDDMPPSRSYDGATDATGSIGASVMLPVNHSPWLARLYSTSVTKSAVI